MTWPETCSYIMIEIKQSLDSKFQMLFLLQEKEEFNKLNSLKTSKCQCLHFVNCQAPCLAFFILIELFLHFTLTFICKWIILTMFLWVPSTSSWTKYHYCSFLQSYCSTLSPLRSELLIPLLLKMRFVKTGLREN